MKLRKNSRHFLVPPYPIFRSQEGYTMTEMVVVLSIVTLISSVVLASFSGFSEQGALSRSSRELALGIRQAQNMSLAVTQIQTQSGPIIPRAVGVRLTLSKPQSFIIFADLVLDFKYNALEDKLIGEESSFQRTTRIKSLTAYNPNPANYSTVHLIFVAPEATVFLTDENGASIGDKLEIKLSTVSGQEKIITVRTNGQISIK